MTLTITIKGKGTVDKVVDGNSTTLTAKPINDWSFKYYKIGSDEIKDNPYSFEIIGELEVLAAFYMSIESYLRGKVAFDISDSAIESALLDREIESNADIADMTEKQRELLYADILMWGATQPSSFTGRKESDGGWTSTGDSKSFQKSDKIRFEQIANDIYEKYGDKRKMNPKIKIVNLW